VHFAATQAVQIQKFLPVYHWIIERRVQITVLFACVLLPLALFGEIAEDVWEGESLDFDHPIQMWARSLTNPTLDAIMVWISHLGAPKTMAALCVPIALTLLIRNRRGDAGFFLISVIGAALLNLLAKLVFRRSRPDLWVSIDPRADFSFPSGHAMGTMALVAAIIVLLWPTPWRIPAVFVGGSVVILVGASRVYLGVHYPSDVLCGWLASLAWVVGLYRIRRLRSGKQISPQPLIPTEGH
jgi:undecaprenyl-diphosphatase